MKIISRSNTETDPGEPNHVIYYQYDEEGNQTFRTDYLNGTPKRMIQQIWREDGRLTERVSSGTGYSSHRAVFDYDNNGNLTTADTYRDGATSPNVSAVSATYSTADEVKSWTESIYPRGGGTATSRTTNYTYLTDGSLAQRSITDITANTSYSYLLNGLASSTSAPWFSGSSFSSTYFPNGFLNTLTLANGATIARTYDPSNREASLTAKKSDGSILSSWLNIAYDEADNRTQESIVQAQPSGLPKEGAGAYGYDKLNRLTSFTHPLDQSTNAAKTYVLDDAGNVTADDDFTYTYDRNRLTERVDLSLVKTTFGYDALGNQISETIGSTVTATSYDAASHPNRVSLPGGDWVEYGYDAFDRMVRRTQSQGGVETTTYFFRDRNSESIALESEGGTEKTRYVLNSGGAPLAEKSAAVGAIYYIRDPRGNLTSVIDGSQNVQGVLGYDPFGKLKENLTKANSASWDSRLKFQMAPQDPKTKAYNIGPRIYDPGINRFVGADFWVAATANLDLQLDPLTGNRYLYAGANPANMIDDGHGPYGGPRPDDSWYGNDGGSFQKQKAKETRRKSRGSPKPVSNSRSGPAQVTSEEAKPQASGQDHRAHRSFCTGVTCVGRAERFYGPAGRLSDGIYRVRVDGEKFFLGLSHRRKASIGDIEQVEKISPLKVRSSGTEYPSHRFHLLAR